MSDTISEFTNFISNDPLMLALCIAIVVLIIVFILVLILGKKKDDDEELTENTTTLLQSDINDANLKSTQEFETVNEAAETLVTSTKKIPVVTPPEEDATDKEAPINIDAALKLKEEREKENPTEVVPTIPAPEMPVSEPITVAPEAPASEPASASEEPAPVTPDPFGLNNSPAPAAETNVDVPAAAPIEIPAAESAPVASVAPAETPTAEIADGSLPGIPDSTVNNSDDTNGMFGNLVESLSEENKDQTINIFDTPTAETPAPAPEVTPTEVAPMEAPTAPEAPAVETPSEPASSIVTGSEASTSVPLAGSPVVKEEKKVSFEPGQKTPEIITGTESKFEEKKEEPKEEAAPVVTEPPGPAVLTPEDEDVELPMLSTPANDGTLNNLSGESFNI